MEQAEAAEGAARWTKVARKEHERERQRRRRGKRGVEERRLKDQIVKEVVAGIQEKVVD